MSSHAPDQAPDHERDLGAGTPAELIALAERLDRERPVPSAAFRGELRRGLLLHAGARGRPTRLRALIVGSAGAGSLLLAIGAASVAGIGPLGA